MKTNVYHKHFYSSSSKNWVSALKHSGICFSHVFGNTYGDLYHYAGNNPVRYIDQDEGKRNPDAEKLTAVGRKAELTEYRVSVTYTLTLKVKMPEENHD